MYTLNTHTPTCIHTYTHMHTSVLHVCVCMSIMKAIPRGSDIKNLPVVRKTQVRSLGQEDPLEKGMATHSSVIAWRIPWTAEPGGLQSMGSQRDRRD